MSVACGLEDWRALPSLEHLDAVQLVPCTNLMNSCLRALQWHQAIHIFELLRDRRCFDTVSLNVALKALAKSGHWTKALYYLTELGNQVRTDIITYTAAIDACQGEWRQALQVFSSLLQSALETDDMVYGAVLSASGTRGWQPAISLLQNSRYLARVAGASLPSFNTLLNLCSVQWRLVIHLFQQLDAHIANSADRITCNIAMCAAGTSFKWQASISFLSLMNLRRIIKNTITCNSIMKTCNDVAKWEHSLFLAMNLPLCRLVPDLVTSSLVTSANGGRWQHVLVVLEEMMETRPTFTVKSKVDAVTCNAALMACEESHNWQMVLELLHDLHNRKVERNIMTYSTAIRCCGNTSAWHISLELFQESTVLGVQADAMALNVLLNALSRGDQWPKALHVLQTADGADVIAYNVAWVAKME